MRVRFVVVFAFSGLLAWSASAKTKADVLGFDFAFADSGDGMLSGFEQYVPGALLMLR